MTTQQPTGDIATGLRPIFERAYLEGRYEALKWVLRSPAIPRHVWETIEAEARECIPKLEKLGAEFREGSS